MSIEAGSFEKRWVVEENKDTSEGNRIDIKTRCFPDGCTPYAKGTYMILDEDIQWDSKKFNILLGLTDLDSIPYWKIEVYIKDKKYTMTKPINEANWEAAISRIAIKLAEYREFWNKVEFLDVIGGKVSNESNLSS